MKQFLLFSLVLFCFFADAQVGRNNLQFNYSTGINFKNLGSRERLFVPLDTLNTGGDSAYLAFLNGRWYGLGSTKWVDLGALKVNDTMYVIAGDTVIIQQSVTPTNIPVKWYNVSSHGADTSGAVDASSIVLAALAAGEKYIYFPKGKYLISNQVQLRDSVTIKGDGRATIIKVSGNISAFRTGWSPGGNGVNFLDLSFVGEIGTSDSTQRAIYIDSSFNVLINNVTAHNMGGFAIYVKNTGFCCPLATGPLFNPPQRGILITNIFVRESFGGVHFGALAEYSSLSNSKVTACIYGVLINAGSTRIVGNSLDYNYYGIAVGPGTNDGHGLAEGNTVNHSRASNIYVFSSTQGFSFVNNMVYAGSTECAGCGITLESSNNVRFTGGDIALNAAGFMNITNCTNTVFNGVFFKNPGNMTWNITGEAPTISNAGAIGVGTLSAGSSGIQKMGTPSSTSGGIVNVTQQGTPLSNDRIGGMAAGANTTAATVRTGATMDFFADGNWTDAVSHPTGVKWSTVPTSSTTLSEKMRLSAAGVLWVSSIGAPSAIESARPAKLHVMHQAGSFGLNVTRSTADQAFANFDLFKNRSADPSVLSGAASGDGIGKIYFTTVAANNTSISSSGTYAVLVESVNTSFVSGFHQWVTINNVGATAERMRLTADGKLSLGYIGIPTYGAHFNRTVSYNKDSLPLISALSTQSVSGVDTVTGQHIRIPYTLLTSGGGPGSKSVVPQYRIAVGILGDTIGSSAVLRYLDSIKQLSAPYINAFNSFTAGSTWYNTKPTKFDVLFGNSITAKTIAQKYLAYSSRLCNMSNTLEINFGIGGTRMVSLTPGDSAMSERTFLIPTYNSSIHNNLYFGYGTNDWRTGSVDSATFRSTYNTVIDAAVAKGWPLDHIVLVSAGYSITANTSLQHRNKEFVDITLHLGKLKGVKVVDVYTTMITNGGIIGLQTDSVHLNEFGNELWALAISDTLGLKVGDVRAGAYMYARQINIKQYLNHPAMSVEDSNGVAYLEIRGWHGSGSFDASIFIGLNAGDSNTTGTNDYAYGQESLRGNTTGSGNNGYGFNTLNKNKTGNYNSAFGHNSLSKATGTRNTAVGAFALQNATAVNDLTSIGYAALQNNTSGINNTAVGASALNANLTGNNNVAIGSNALVSGTTISNNTAAGASAMFNNLTGNTNAAFGYLSLFTFTSGVGNSAFGPNTLRLLQGASSLNSAFGSGALEIATTSSRNTAVGASGMKQVTSGGNNTGIGYAHGDSITTGLENFFGGYQSGFNLQGAASRNIFLGSNSGLNWRLGNDNIVIGQYLVPANTNWSKKVIISQDGDTAALVIDSNLNVGIGVLNPAAKLDIDGNLRIRSVTTGTQATDSSLVISGGVVKAVKAQVATDGIFTPTLTNTTNVSASAAYPGQWSRNGNTVTMSGEVDIDPTAGATLTVLTMTIPVASTLGNSYNLSGTASNDDVIGNTARVKSNGAGAAVISFIPNLLTSGRYSYIYQYTIN